MRIVKWVRRSTSQMRVLVAFLALALSLDIIAHAPHSHFKDFASGGTQTVVCDYCVAFSAAMDGPVCLAVLRAPIRAFQLPVSSSTPTFSPRPETEAQPRAPPLRS